MQYGLTTEEIEKLLGVFSQYASIEKVILYGSRAKGNFRAGSDVDITLEGQINFDTLHSVEQNIEDLCLIYNFDISIFNQLSNQDLIEHINRVGKVIYSG